MRRGHLLLVSLIALALAGCVPKPKQDYRLEQIMSIESLEEIMRVQAQTMDPLFSLRDRSSYTADDLAAMVRASRRLQATSRTLHERFAAKYPQQFSDFVSAQATGAEKLLGAAEAGRAPEAAATLRAIKDTCAACHKAFK